MRIIVLFEGFTFVKYEYQESIETIMNELVYANKSAKELEVLVKWVMNKQISILFRIRAFNCGRCRRW